MGTILDYVSVYSNTNAIRTASRSVSQYSTTLQMDLMAIDLLVDSQVQKDKNQSELFKQGTGIFDTCLTP